MKKFSLTFSHSSHFDKCISTEKVSKFISLFFFSFFIFIILVKRRNVDGAFSLGFDSCWCLFIFFILLIEVYISIVGIDYWNRPYYSKCTRSHPNSEVKRDKAGLVLRWGTAWETPVLIPFLFFLFEVFSLYYKFQLKF